MSEGPNLGAMLSLQNHGHNGASAGGASQGEIYEMRGPLSFELQEIGEALKSSGIKIATFGVSTMIETGLFQVISSGPTSLLGTLTPTATPFNAKSSALLKVRGG